MTQVENTIKNATEYVEFLEASEQETFTKEEVIETLKGFKTKGNGQRRGQLAGLTLDQMTDEQLKRELVNAKSVLYKAQQRDASEEAVARNQARVDAALAEKAKRTPEAPATEEVAVEGSDNQVYADVDTANEL